MFNGVFEIFELIGWEFGWAGKTVWSPKCCFPIYGQEQIQFTWWEMLVSPSGQRALLREKRQPSLFSWHWNILISHLLFILVCIDAWENAREEDWLARRCPPFLNESPDLYHQKTSPTPPMRCWWMSLQMLRNDSALPVQRVHSGAAFWRPGFSW